MTNPGPAGTNCGCPLSKTIGTSAVNDSNSAILRIALPSSGHLALEQQINNAIPWAIPFLGRNSGQGPSAGSLLGNAYLPSVWTIALGKTPWTITRTRMTSVG